jgi:hypothetical protein
MWRETRGPYFPLLFNAAVDVLAKILEKDKIFGHISRKFTSKGSKSVLINSCLASLPMYILGLYLLPEGVHGNFDKELSRFF